MAAKNEAINLIGRYTRSKRARIIRSTEDPTRKYLCRTVSLQEVEPVLEKEATTGSPLFDTIRVQLGPEYERYAKAILGSWPDFDEWVASNHKQQTDKLPASMLESYAREWSGITTEQAQDDLAPLLAQQLLVQKPLGYLADSQPT